MPPPRVSPPTPVVEMMPPVVARPWACVASLNVAPRGAALGASRPGLGIDLNVRHPGQVDDHCVVAGAEAGDAVAAGANGHGELVLARVVHRRDDVVG